MLALSIGNYLDIGIKVGEDPKLRQNQSNIWLFGHPDRLMIYGRHSMGDSHNSFFSQTPKWTNIWNRQIHSKLVPNAQSCDFLSKFGQKVNMSGQAVFSKSCFYCNFGSKCSNPLIFWVPAKIHFLPKCPKNQIFGTDKLIPNRIQMPKAVIFV